MVSSVRRGVALWLSAILICLSFAASAHSVEHIDHGVQEHCTLCFHKHQLNKLLPSELLHLAVVSQTFEPIAFQLIERHAVHTNAFRSRAPPISV
ncbi:ABC-type zinc uptake system zinc chaperone [Shewanella sp. UCD-KL12]|uniref:ABC-type zinc uptake system zinc chaperone n=1 Tax=Shewanella sp. UCD-KL12 TaxID=1917163 RepID=UPI0009702272|nr:ABC-type zinc uptake system zinc chaperone [Shewanella sp. UCD-KL12]